MGKKRKVIEISEDERIKTIVVRDPYAWGEPSSWDSHDRNRNDNGLYPFVEWMEYILGGMGAPGSQEKQKRLGPAVLNVWHWSGRSGRNELIVSVRKDIDVSPVLGDHVHSRFVRQYSQRDITRKSVIYAGRYTTEEDIEEKGEGWRPFPKTPEVLLRDVRRNLFVEPYPAAINLKNGVKVDQKPTIKQETKPNIGVKSEAGIQTTTKREAEATGTIFPQTEPPDIKPIIKTERIKEEPGQTGSAVASTSRIQVKAEDNSILPAISEAPPPAAGVQAAVVKTESNEGADGGPISADVFARIKAHRAQDLRNHTQGQGVSRAGAPQKSESGSLATNETGARNTRISDDQRPSKRIKIEAERRLG